ncbi:uncharacterized protein LOC126404174 isoform X2 [Epinephelus moara]|uniref:uncharacterized protein LOC126404174 isoform X2 n=1 Tax=Epinephelus moara TaxID=300413 RepID=UPI00214F481D|nr:uncharacterized protein LOC126404174 isoform X2 [Epinephelus moara]
MGLWWSSAETRGAQQLPTNSTDMGIQLSVRGITGEMKIINLCDTKKQLSSMTGLQLKKKIIEEFGLHWHPSDLHLICGDKALEEPTLLSECGIRHMSTIFVVLRLPGGGPHPAETRGAQQLDTNSTDMGIQLKVRLGTGEKQIINLCDTEEQLRSITVLQLKEKIAEEFGLHWHPSDFRLMSCDGSVQEPALLSEYGISHMSDICVVQILQGGGGGRPPPRRSLVGMGDKDGKNRSMETVRFF